MHQIFIHRASDLVALFKREVETIPIVYVKYKKDVAKLQGVVGLLHRGEVFLAELSESGPLLLGFTVNVRDDFVGANSYVSHTDTLSRAAALTTTEEVHADTEFSEMDLGFFAKYLSTAAFQILYQENHIDLRGKEVRYKVAIDESVLFEVDLEKEQRDLIVAQMGKDEEGFAIVSFQVEYS